MRAAANTHRALKQDEVKEKLQVNSELDEWIRRRMGYWKQWRWPRTKIKNLLALGVSLKSAIQHGCSSNSYWQMSRTPVINQAISNAWLQEQGLLSVKDLWCKAQGYTANKRKAWSSVPTC
jgi:RNA-directed DNA polymerase